MESMLNTASESSIVSTSNGAIEPAGLEMELLDCGPAYRLNESGVLCGCYCIAAIDDAGPV
jgi:hypothetical protein